MASSSFKQINTSSNGNSAPSYLPNKPPFLPSKPAGYLASNPAPPKIDTVKVKAENMSAAERLKAELRGELPAQEEEDKPEAKVEETMPVDESRGVKRKADEADVPPSRSDADADSILDQPAQDAEQEEDDDEVEEGPSILVNSEAKVPFVPKPLNVLGDNMVEQEDTVK